MESVRLNSYFQEIDNPFAPLTRIALPLATVPVSRSREGEPGSTSDVVGDVGAETSHQRLACHLPCLAAAAA